MRTQLYSSYQDLFAQLEIELPGLTREQQLTRLRWVTGQVAVQAGIKAGVQLDLSRLASPAPAVVRADKADHAPRLMDQLLRGAAVIAMMAPKLIRLEAVLKQDDPSQILSALKDIVQDLPASGGMVITA